MWIPIRGKNRLRRTPTPYVWVNKVDQGGRTGHPRAGKKPYIESINKMHVFRVAGNSIKLTILGIPM